MWMRRPAWVLCASLWLAACNGASAVPRFLRSDTASAPTIPIPSQYAASGAPAQPAAGDEERARTEAELRAEFAVRAQEAQALWNEAERTTDPVDAADLYADIAEDYPEYPNAAEAKYREGLNLYRAGEHAAAIRALKEYMVIAPVNPHLAQVEEVVYRSGIAYIEEDLGILGVFRTDEEGLDALRWVAVNFPAGAYPDDALLRLGRYYQEDGELATATLFYKELLLRYPDSEWSFEARRGLAATYVARDQGDVYHAGFVDRDPREKVPDDERAQAHAGPVKSGLELALEQYDLFLERIARDPGRRVEYAAQVAEVEAARRSARAQLAAKDERIAAWYAGQGDAQAAAVYRRSAARWRGQTTESIVPTPTPPPAAPAPAAPVVGPSPTPPPVEAPRPARPRVPPPPPPPPASVPPAATPPPVAPAPVRPAPTGARARLPVPPPPPPPAWPPDR